LHERLKLRPIMIDLDEIWNTDPLHHFQLKIPKPEVVTEYQDVCRRHLEFQVRWRHFVVIVR
jgi:hypothetical protein